MTHDHRNDLIKEVFSFQPQKILVIGDLMLDQYIWGTVERISPEAPIPVVRMEKEEFRLGGAANVAANIAKLDCKALLVGLIGNCHSGQLITDIMTANGISPEGVIASDNFQTIVKQRILTYQQQLLRLDYESNNPDFRLFEEELLARIRLLLPKVDGVIISDYRKGVITERLIKETIREAHSGNLPIVCDPARGRSFEFYRGVTAIKPNRIETEEATLIKLDSKDAMLEAASLIKSKCAADFLTISMDKDGALYYRDDGHYTFLKSESPEVHDSVGAGDVFVSMLVILLAKGVSEEVACRLANIAGGLETSHLGVVSIPWSDIITHLSSDNLNRKIVTVDRLIQEISNNRKQPLIFTNGYFDNVSAGHLRFLMEINRIPGNLVVAINSDQSIIEQKGSAPLLKEQDRARLLASIENVHRVIIFNEQDASSLIQQLSPDIVVKGESFINEKLPEQHAIDSSGAKIEFIQHFSW